ncbi:MAG: DUF2997 domain-containing protein [Deltaproteobacteria bacterium]|nr:DUF2997 domain-containing protein [Deltaproteobacteria bacterium]
MKEIVLKFDIKSGECRVDAKGFKGDSCVEATRFLKDCLGTCTDFQRKAEWYEKNLEILGRVHSNLCG